MVVGLAGQPNLWYSGGMLEQDWEPCILPLPLTLHLSPHVELEADNSPVACMLRRCSIYTGKILALLLPD